MRTPERPLVVCLARPEYDLSSVEELAAELEAVGGQCTTIDFKNVRYIDSSCLTQLVAAGHRLKAVDPSRTITLVNLEDQVRRIFEITQLGRFFDLQ